VNPYVVSAARVGFGDLASSGAALGLSAASAGGVSLDPSQLAGNLPPSLQQAYAEGAQAAQAAAGGSAAQQVSAAAGAIAAATAPLVPYGTVVAGAILAVTALFNALGGATATTQEDFVSLFGQPPASAPGSFEDLTRQSLIATFNAAFTPGGKAATIAQAETILGVALAAAVRGWNQTHAGPSAPFTISGVNPSGWGGLSDPLAVAATGLVRAAGGPWNTTLTFALNQGAPVKTPQGLKLNPALVTIQAKTAASTGMSTPAKVATGAAVVAGGGLVWGLVTSYMTHKPLNAVFSGAWRGAFKR